MTKKYIYIYIFEYNNNKKITACQREHDPLIVRGRTKFRPRTIKCARKRITGKAWNRGQFVRGYTRAQLNFDYMYMHVYI